MDIPGEAQRLRIHIGANDVYAGRTLVEAIVDRARAAGMAGATAWRGLSGFGASAHVHRVEQLALSHDLPIVIDIIDSAEKIDAFLATVQTMVATALITVEPVRVVRYGAATAGQR